MQIVSVVRSLAASPESARRSGYRASPALRGVALVAAMGLLLAEWGSLHHRATAAHDAEHLATVSAGAATSQHGGSELVGYDALSAGELAHDRCLICSSSRERLASAASGARYAIGSADPTLQPRAELGERACALALYAIAPKTSPPG